MSFIKNVQVLAPLSLSQASYDAIGSTNRFKVLINMEGNSGKLSRGSNPNSAMAGVVRTEEEGNYNVSDLGVIGNITEFLGTGTPSVFLPGRKQDAVTLDKVLGLQVTLHMTEEEVEAIQAEMTRANAKAVEVTVDLSPLSFWIRTVTETGAQVPAATAFSKLEGVQALLTDCATTAVNPNEIDGEAMRQAQANARQATKQIKRVAKQQLGSVPNINRPTIDISKLAPAITTTV